MRMSYTLGLKIIASENVAKNILVAGGHTEIENGRLARTRLLAACEISIR
jgi:hypothetical protein